MALILSKSVKKISNDISRMSTIYKNIAYPQYDYLLLENTVNFDWKRFLQEFYMYCSSYGDGIMLCESVELLSSDHTGDKYEITLSQGNKFKFNINIICKERIKATAFASLYANLKDKSILQDLLNTIDKTTKPIIHLIFENENHMKTLTGKVGIFTWSLLSGIRTAFSSHSFDRQYYPDVIFYETLDEADKRNQVYTKFFEADFKSVLNNFYIDKKGVIKTNYYYWKSL